MEPKNNSNTEPTHDLKDIRELCLPWKKHMRNPNATPEELQQSLVEQFNQTKGDKEGFDCPTCLNKGYIAYLDKQGQKHLRSCDCMQRRQSIRHLERSGMMQLASRYTLKNWQTGEDWQKELLNLGRQWLEQGQDQWFFLSGTPGTGKTHFCVALCNILLGQNRAVRYCLWRDLAVQAKACVNDHAAYQNLIEPLKRVQVLYLDDLFKTGKGQEPTVGDVNLAFELLNVRYNDPSLVTLLSSECNIQDIIQMDEAIGSRIYERARQFYVDLSGKQNYRLLSFDRTFS